MTNISSNAAPLRQSAGQGGADDIIDLGQLFATLWRGKWIIALITTLAVLAGGYYAFVTAVPLFRSTAVVMLETKQQSIVDLESVVGGLTGDSSEINSEVEVLRSRGLIGKVVDRLDLISDPEFNSVLRPVSLMGSGKSEIKAALGLPDVQIILPPEEQEKRTRDAVITELLEQITVRNVPLSLVFQITAETESPEKSTRIADTLVELYVLNQLEVKFEATEQATSWLTGRVAELQVELEAAGAKVSEFSTSTDLISIEALQAQEIQLKDLRERIGNAETAAMNTAAKEVALSNVTSRQDQALLAGNVQLNRLLPRVAENEQMAQAFDTQFARVLTRAKLDTTRAQQQLLALRNSSQEMEQQIASRGQDLITLQQLTREAEAVRLLYEYFLSRLKETSAQQGIQKADSRILSRAVVPSNAASPKKPLILAMSSILGLMIGMGLVLLREARANAFRTARDLEQHTGYTVLGQIPQIPARSRKKILNYLANKPASAAAEAVRNLRTSVLLSNVDNPAKVIMSTSSVPGEGKTTNSLALAQNLIGLGKSVLLIEGDIRRRTFAQYFDDIPEKGLVSVLSGDQTLEETVFKTPVLGADLLVGDKTASNAADLFASDKFKALIADVRQKYDVIIIDTPPVLVVPDARIIAEIADVVLFSVLWDSTSKHQVDEALRMFQNSNQRITGLVLSQINAKRMKQYGYGGRYGAYAGYGSKYYTN
ncbi:polysaccharide biosynthesis tyrosine autokinase [Parasedimentitalea marina]|uniref:non-specific protein-tyrosine kinase n=1 Tax=Parasedimentitalea marina TaxID=2483033 RepID=A0A3T0N5R6_9RHOB|nr:polysaccharide biosynthesis tyrosine autokinase [Parasedimentitalea marina]AZV79331.1 polysaccharide biosynthesis tyrosine autokinase [Parasedimentitalea marina]